MNEDEMIKDIQRTLIECCNYIDDKKGLLGNKCGNCEFWCDTNNLCASYEKKQATAIYNADYRKVGEDEIVVKKSKIGMLEKTIDYLEMEKAQLYKQREQAEQETAREILRTIETYGKHYKSTDYMIVIIKHRYGIE